MFSKTVKGCKAVKKIIVRTRKFQFTSLAKSVVYLTYMFSSHFMAQEMSIYELPVINIKYK